MRSVATFHTSDFTAPHSYQQRVYKICVDWQELLSYLSLRWLQSFDFNQNPFGQHDFPLIFCCCCYCRQGGQWSPWFLSREQPPQSPQLHNEARAVCKQREDGVRMHSCIQHSVLSSRCSCHTVLRAQTNAFIQWPESSLPTWLGSTPWGCTHSWWHWAGCQASPSVYKAAGQGAQDWETKTAARVTELLVAWVHPQRTQGQWTARPFPGYVPVSVPGRDRTQRAPEPKHKSQQIQNQMHLPPHFNRHVDKTSKQKSGPSWPLLRHQTLGLGHFWMRTQPLGEAWRQFLSESFGKFWLFFPHRKYWF